LTRSISTSNCGTVARNGDCTRCALWVCALDAIAPVIACSLA